MYTYVQKPAQTLRPFIVPVFIPHAGCPHKCVFCNQQFITGSDSGPISPKALTSHIDRFLGYKGPNRQPAQIAFYGGNFLGLSRRRLSKLLEIANTYVKKGQVSGIRFSTRPDTIDQAKLNLIASYPVTTIELGVQSMHDDVLAAAGRGHTAADTRRAVVLLKKKGYQIGLQIMLGLPADDETKALATAQQVASFKPDFVRIYPTIVIANSVLARWYRKGRYHPLTLDEAVILAKKHYLIFRANGIKVARMGLQADTDLDKGTTVLAGPYHPAFGHLVHGQHFLDLALNQINGSNHKSVTSNRNQTLILKVHPYSIPKMRGQGNCNIKTLIQRFFYRNVALIPDSSLGLEEVQIGRPSAAAVG